ncbi:hypothetical protein C8F01DRAFT_1134232 [Mycena amicta]|nr:hypothetical protein C8F01DRAFT_1134232 [Mycena amicta]
MHASLKLSSLAPLPPTLKASALAAARGSLRDFDSFVRSIADPSFVKSHLPRLVCVLYAALDPTPISSFLADESPSTADNNAFAEVLARALRAINSLDLWTNELEPHQTTSPSVFHDLWPRIWAWIQFLDTFCESGLVAFPNPSIVHYYQALCAITSLANRSTLLPRQILDTPHFFDFLGEIWAHLIDGPNELLPLNRRLSGLAQVSALIYADLDSLGNDRNRFEELCRGVGGRESIARLCISTIKLFFPNNSAQYPQDAYYVLYGVVSFFALPAARDVRFLQALDQEGFPTHLTIAMRAVLANIDDPRPGDKFNVKSIIGLCFSVLSHGLFGHSIYRDASFIEALKAGYLVATYSYLRHVPPDTAGGFIASLKCNMMYFSTSRKVLRQLLQDKAELRNMEVTSHFSSAVAAQTWDDILAFTCARLELFEEYRKLLLHGCENFACGRLHAKTDISRCGRCSQVQYCSHACQRIDWKQRHQAHCARSAAGSGGLKLRYGRQRHLVLDASFMRWLMNRDYLAQEETIALLLLRFFALHRSNGTIPYFVFNWMKGPELGRLCRITVEPLSKTPKLEELYAEDIDRARNSRGRFQLHFFGSMESPEKWVPFPMYSTSSLIYEGLEALAAGISADEAQDMDMELYRDEIRELLKLEVSTGGLKTH